MHLSHINTSEIGLSPPRVGSAGNRYFTKDSGLAQNEHFIGVSVGVGVVLAF